MLRIDTQTTVVTTYRNREDAVTLRDKIAADDTVGDVAYTVEENLRGFFIAVRDAETGDFVGTL